MDMNEFNAKAKRKEINDEVQFDVRPFGDKQGEAIDSYLHDLLAALQQGVAPLGFRRLVLPHGSTAVIPKSAYAWLDQLNSSRICVEIRLL